jgi:hypothetical protein
VPQVLLLQSRWMNARVDCNSEENYSGRIWLHLSILGWSRRDWRARTDKQPFNREEHVRWPTSLSHNVDWDSR